MADDSHTGATITRLRSIADAPSWFARTKALLTEKGLAGALKTTCTDEDMSEKAKAVLIRLVDDKHINTIERADSCAAAWAALHAMYDVSSNARTHVLLKQFATLSLQPTESIMDFVSRAETLMHDL
jgi:hypothetical protein